MWSRQRRTRRDQMGALHLFRMREIALAERLKSRPFNIGRIPVRQSR
jgi:hypothetical protein